MILNRTPATEKIYNAVINGYKTIRNNPDTINIVLNEMNDILDNNRQPDEPEIYNRLLSVISLKYDTLLQLAFENNNDVSGLLDDYYNKIKWIISKRAFLIQDFTPPKIAECLAKIQYAHILNNDGINIRQTFVDYMDYISHTDVYTKIIKDLNNETNKDGESPGMMLFYYLFFRKENGFLERSGGYHRYAIIITYWKRYKITHYKMTKNQIEGEGYEAYDFIYRRFHKTNIL